MQVKNKKLTKKNNYMAILANELRIGNWVKIKGFEDYSISDKGEVFSHRRNKLMSIWSKSGEYPRVTLSKSGKEKTFTIHRLVAEAFIPNPYGKITVNHKDGNKNNNKVDNLEWNTYSENQKHAIKNGLAIVPHLGFGEQHPCSKLNNVDIEMIRVLLNHDFTQSQIAKRFGVHEVHISQIKLNKSRKND